MTGDQHPRLLVGPTGRVGGHQRHHRRQRVRRTLPLAHFRRGLHIARRPSFDHRGGLPSHRTHPKFLLLC